MKKEQPIIKTRECFYGVFSYYLENIMDRPSKRFLTAFQKKGTTIKGIVANDKFVWSNTARTHSHLLDAEGEVYGNLALHFEARIYYHYPPDITILFGDKDQKLFQRLNQFLRPVCPHDSTLSVSFLSSSDISRSSTPKDIFKGRATDYFLRFVNI